MSFNSSNQKSAAMNWVRFPLLGLMCLALAAGCEAGGAAGGGSGGSGGSGGGDDGSNGNDDPEDVGTDGLIDARIFEVDMEVKSYNTSSDDTPQFDSAATLLFGTVPIDPLAVRYTAEYVNTESPALDVSASWDPRNIAGTREPVPDEFAVSEAVVPGYDGGVVGGEFFLVVLRTGCQGGAGGECMLGTETTLEREAGFRDVRATGTLTVTIEFE